MWLKGPADTFLALHAVLGLLVGTAHSLGSQCTTPLTQGSAGVGDPFWLENIAHQGISIPFVLVRTVSTEKLCTSTGIAAFNSYPETYTVFRNVKVRLFSLDVSGRLPS